MTDRRADAAGAPVRRGTRRTPRWRPASTRSRSTTRSRSAVGSSTSRTIGSLLFGLLLLFLLFRVVFGDNFDWSDVGSCIRGADPTFLLLAFLAYYATFPLRGLRWKYILSKIGTDVDAPRTRPRSSSCRGS